MDCGHCRIRDHWHDASVQKQQRDSAFVSRLDDHETQNPQEITMAAKNSKDWVQKAGIKKGAFTEKAKKRGLTAAQFQAKVLKDPTKYDSTTVKQANLRKTLVSKKMKGKRK